MVFATPWLLLALVALPLLWWLLRVTPPAPREERFPAIRLLAGLRADQETPAHTPPWLLALRLLAAGLVIVGLAGPILGSGGRLPGSGPVLLVMDDGWASAADWPNREQAADAVLDAAARDGRRAALLTLARNEAGTAPTLTPVMPIGDLRPRVAALKPKPWQDDRAAAAAALSAWRQGGTAVAYMPDGLAAPGDAALRRALDGIGPVTEYRPEQSSVRLLLPPKSEADRLVATIAFPPLQTTQTLAVLAQSGDGRTLGRTNLEVPAGSTTAQAAIVLPAELRNRLARLVLDGPPQAGGVVLLDERWRRRPVGMLAGDAATADTPLTGELYYLRQALAPTSELRQGTLQQLLSRDLSVLILADRPVTDPTEIGLLTDWVRKGGVLVRFAGPRMAELESDTAGSDLMPVRLLAGDRQLGGTMSWSQPAGLAPFPPGSPFAGLPVTREVTVSRQVLAEPSADLPAHTWAALADGTPLVTEATLGAGRVVLFHVTANADWSNLPLSGLFVSMLNRLVQLSAGVATTPGTTILAPSEVLDGFGQPTNPGPAARGVAANRIAGTPAGPRSPPGLYGPESGRAALNLSANLPQPVAAAAIPGARVATLGAALRQRALGPWLLGAALALLAFDLLLSLRLRGLLRGAAAALLLGAVLASPLGSPFLASAAHAQDSDEQNPALVTRLAYVVTGDPAVDQMTKAGLAGLSDYVNRRTAAHLGDPAPVTPGQDDLSFYPILYWALPSDAEPPGAAAIAAMNDFMGHGGILLIDTRGQDDALPAVARGLVVPALTQLTTDHVLARSFYLLDQFPGREVGAPVWVQRDQDRTNDSVSPVIIGANDWASAWATDDAGRPLVSELEGGARQRTLAYRFGVNLVMYALTGNYKGDQVHVPAILERLGQ